MKICRDCSHYVEFDENTKRCMKLSPHPKMTPESSCSWFKGHTSGEFAIESLLDSDLTSQSFSTKNARIDFEKDSRGFLVGTVSTN